MARPRNLREYRNKNHSLQVNRRVGLIMLIRLKPRWEHWQTPHKIIVVLKSQRADLTKEWRSRKKKMLYMAVSQRELRNWWKKENTSRKFTRFVWAKLLVGIWTLSWMASRSACLIMVRRLLRVISKRKLRLLEFYYRRRGSLNTASSIWANSCSNMLRILLNSLPVFIWKKFWML